MPTATAVRACKATHFGVVRECGGAPDYDVITRDRAGVETARHEACMAHGLAEMSARLVDDPTLDLDVVPAARR